MTDARSEQLAAALADVRARIDRACVMACRDTGEVTLVVVTKTFPAQDVARLAALGVRDVGENRDQDAADKARSLETLGLRWHFIGQLQRNKARSVAAYADVVHSLDRAELVVTLDKGAQAADRQVEVLIQVDLDPSAVADGRGGARPDQVAALADQVASTSGLVLGGVMAVAPRDVDPAAAFARLREISLALVADHPAAGAISAGMSGDLEQAVAAGATLLRVGSAILGQRPLLQ